MFKSFMYRLKLILILAVLLLNACSNATLRETVINSNGSLTTISVSDAKFDAAEPAVAVDGGGNIYVLYVEHNSDKTADLFMQKFDPDPKVPLSIIRVNPVAGTVKAWRGDPPTIGIAKNGTIYIGWTIKAGSGEKAASDLVLSASADGGKTFAASVRVNDDTAPASHGMHSLLVSGDQVYMAWLDERNVKQEPAHEDPKPAAAMMFHHTKEPAEPNSEVFFSVSSDGGKTFSTNKKLATEVCPCCKTSMALAPDGRIYVSWRQVLPGGFRHIAVASSSDKGATFSAGVVVSDDKWKIDACPVSGAALSAGEGGFLSVSWYSAGEAGEAGVYSAESRDAGKTFGPRGLVSSDAGSGTPILTENGACVFAAKENIVSVRAGPVHGTNHGAILSIPEASLPSAVTTGGKTYVAFVRTSGEKRSVWLAHLGN